MAVLAVLGYVCGSKWVFSVGNMVFGCFLAGLGWFGVFRRTPILRTRIHMTILFSSFIAA